MKGQYHTAFEISKPSFQLDFQEDGTVSGVHLYENFAGTWGFQVDYQGKSYEGGYEEIDTVGYFNFYLDFSDDTAVYCQYQVREKPLLFLVFSDELQVCLLRETGMDAKLTGTAWSSESPGGYSLIFHEDHTFTANLPDETIIGGWATRPFWQNADETLVYSPFMWYEQDGQTLSFSSIIFPEISGETDPVHFTPGYISFVYQNRTIVLKSTSAEAIEKNLRALDKAAQVLVGTWAATSYAPYSNDGTSTDLQAGYSFTFFENGTFTGFVGRNITGTWKIHPTEEQDRNGAFSYRFYINEDKTEHYAVLHHYDDSDAFDTIWFYPDTSSSTDGSYILTLTHYPESWQEALPRGRELVIGSYTSSAKITYSGTDDGDLTETKDYTMVFREDGTFSGQLDIPVNGTWEMDSYSETDDIYQIRMTCDQEGLDAHASFLPFGYIGLSINGQEQEVFYQLWNDQVDTY